MERHTQAVWSLIHRDHPAIDCLALASRNCLLEIIANLEQQLDEANQRLQLKATAKQLA